MKVLDLIAFFSFYRNKQEIRWTANALTVKKVELIYFWK